mgnify:CR=1 FL=1
MINLYLSLGSNLGDRKANLEEALRRLDEAFGTGYASLSDFIETESWGFEAGKFINCAVLYQLPRQRQTAEDQALDMLIPKYITSIIYGAMVQSVASENGARMQAMDSATSNAEEMIDNLTLMYNRARQGSITQELTEIIAGANAIS